MIGLFWVYRYLIIDKTNMLLLVFFGTLQSNPYCCGSYYHIKSKTGFNYEVNIRRVIRFID